MIAAAEAPLVRDISDARLVDRVDVTGIGEARDAWIALEATGHATPCHRHDWLEAWHRHVGTPAGVEAAVLVGRDAGGTPLFIWPLGIETRLGLRTAGWLAGRHVNYQMGLYAPASMARIGPADLKLALRTLRDECGVDALRLVNQPRSWAGIPNPLLRLPSQPAPSQAYSLSISGAEFDTLYPSLASSRTRRKLRQGERRIAQASGSFSIRRPATPAEAEAVVDVFLQQKRARMAALDCRNAFDVPGMAAFLREMATRSVGTERPFIDLYWLQAGETVAATFGAAGDGRRMSGLFNSFEPEGFAAFHPGEVLLRHVVELACRQRYEVFDLGAGDAPYKRTWCPQVDPLFETHLALTVRGMPASLGRRAFASAKRHAKASPAVMRLARRVCLA